MKMISRRTFLKNVVKFSTLLFSLSKVKYPFGSSSSFAEVKNRKKLIVVSGGTKQERIKKIFETLGGIDKLIPKQAKIAIKPNASFSRTPPQAVNTDPDIMYHLVKLCKDNGAKQIIAFDYPSDPAEIAFKMNGIKDAVEKGGGKMVAAEQPHQYIPIDVSKSAKLKKQMVNKDVAESDFFINVPIPKNHNVTTLTMAMKNLMGVIWDRDSYHTVDGEAFYDKRAVNLNHCIAELATALKPDLNIMDAGRILLTKGPQGPGKTKKLDMTIACSDIVLIDAYTATLFGKKADDIPYIKYAYELGAGEIDVNKADLITVQL